MKAIKILSTALAAIGALIVGLHLPRLIVRVQSSQRSQAFPVEIVDLENITEDTSVAEMLSLVYNRGFSTYYYHLSKGRYLTAEDVEKICTDMANQIFKEDMLGVDMYFEAQPDLCALDDGTSYVLWNCELWVSGCCLSYLVDDARGSILKFEINNNANDMLEKTLNGTSQTITEDTEIARYQTELVHCVAEALRQNLKYDNVTVTLQNGLAPFEQYFQIVLTDQNKGESVMIPVAVYDQYYLCVNL